MKRSLIPVLAAGMLLFWTGCQSGPDGQVSSPQLAKAKQLIEQGNYQAALLQLNQALALAPQDPDVHLNLGWLYLYTENLAKAKQELERVEQLAPDQAETYHLRGSWYSYQAQRAARQDKPAQAVKSAYDAALTNYNEALERAPDNYQIYFDLATSLSAMDQEAEALDVLNRGFEHIPVSDLETQVNFQIASCALHAELGMYEEAIAECRQAEEFTTNKASRQRIEDMIQNLQLMDPNGLPENQAYEIGPKGALHPIEAQEQASVDVAPAN